jgi:hypothetical protein
MTRKVHIKCLAHEEKTALWLLHRVAYHHIIWSREAGEIVVEDVDGSFKTMSRNHLKTILRRDYLTAHGPFPNLTRILDSVLDFCRDDAIYGDREGDLITIAGKLDS